MRCRPYFIQQHRRGCACPHFGVSLALREVPCQAPSQLSAKPRRLTAISACDAAVLGGYDPPDQRRRDPAPHAAVQRS